MTSKTSQVSLRICPWLTRIVYVHLIYKHSVFKQLQNDLCRRVALCCGCTFGHLAECAEQMCVHLVNNGTAEQ